MRPKVLQILFLAIMMSLLKLIIVTKVLSRTAHLKLMS